MDIVFGFVFLGLVNGATSFAETARPYPPANLESCAVCHSHRKAAPPGHQDLLTKHFSDAGKCTTCHVAGHVERLQLLTGDKTDSIPVLCGQCHGLKKRDWDLGIHGKQVGGWQKSGNIDCTRCHNAHDPKFKPMHAVQAPHRPKLGIKKGEENE